MPSSTRRFSSPFRSPGARPRWRLSGLVAFGLPPVLALSTGCGANGDGAAKGTQVAGPSGSSNNGGMPGATSSSTPNANATPTSSEASTAVNFTGTDNDPEPSSMGCQQATLDFKPKIPTVFILVDRSGSMFTTIPGTMTNAWDSLRGGVLQVIQNLQADVSFGFGAFSGQQNATGTTSGSCLDMPGTSPDLNNYSAIATQYTPLEKSSYKDTPTLLALASAAQTLWQDPAEGDKYILFVTDGQPDYCDDGNPLCPPDSVVSELQRLAAGKDDSGATQVPIHTLVFGVDSPISDIAPEVLQAFANAGTGQPVAAPSADPNAVYDQCQSVVGWAAEFAKTGKPAMRGQTTGDYATPGGTATVYRPDPTNQAALIQQIQTALAGVKSCSFDLASNGVKVDTTRVDLGDLAHVLINGTAVPYDATDGWQMLSPTTVELVGQACTNWRVPGETSISFDFPCDVVIVR